MAVTISGDGTVTGIDVQSLGATWQTYTPIVKQGTATNIAKIVNEAKYIKVGDMVTAFCTVSTTASGASGIALISLPFTSGGGQMKRVGAGHVYDANTGTRYTGMAEVYDSDPDYVGFVGDWSAGSFWGITPTLTLASGDQLSFSVTYEAA